MQEFEYRLEKEDYKNWIHWNVLKHESKKMKMVSALLYVAFLALFLGKNVMQAKGNLVLLVPSIVIAVLVGIGMFYMISNQNQERMIWKRSGLKNLEKTGNFPVVHLTLDEKTLTRYRRKHLGYVFQMYNLIPNLNVKENVEVGAYLSDNPFDVDDLLKTLGLYEHRHKLPNQLSGGQQQRTSIGRAIVKNPDILLCDEPTGALDYNTSKEILKLIEDVNQKYGNTIIMVTHNDAIKNMADRTVKLRDGMIRRNIVNENKISAVELDW